MVVMTKLLSSAATALVPTCSHITRHLVTCRGSKATNYLAIARHCTFGVVLMSFDILSYHCTLKKVIQINYMIVNKS